MQAASPTDVPPNFITCNRVFIYSGLSLSSQADHLWSAESRIELPFVLVLVYLLIFFCSEFTLRPSSRALLLAAVVLPSNLLSWSPSARVTATRKPPLRC